MRLFSAIYPVFIKFSPEALIKNPKDLLHYRKARHKLNLHKPFECLTHLGRIEGEVHIVFALLKAILIASENIPTPDACEKINYLADFEESKERFFSDPVFFGKWCLLPRDTDQLMSAIKKGDWDGVKAICSTLKNKSEPPRPSLTIKSSEKPRQLVEDDELIDVPSLESQMSLSST